MLHRVFVDTNCFLHLRDLKDLPWAEIFPGGDVEILIAPIVIDELDRLKTDRVGRIRDRSRSALKTIVDASAEPQMRLRLRERPNRIWITVAEAPRVDWSVLFRLDATRADDQLVAAAISEPGEKASILSFDAGPLIRARLVGLTAHRSPENWSLPPQLDKAEMEVARLERELAVTKATKPMLTARFVDADDTGILPLTIPQLPALPSGLQARLMREVERQLPREHVVATSRAPYGIDIGLGGISQSAADRYHSAYDAFLDEHRQQVANLHELVEQALHFGELRYEILNDSHVTAARLRTSLTSTEPMQLFGGRADMEPYGGALRRINRPRAPDPHAHLSLYRPPIDPWREPERDPTGFYWLERPAGTSVAVETCEEFRPEQHQLSSVFAINPDSDGGKVVLHISATNLAKPLIVSCDVVFERRTANWNSPEVLRRLPEWMAELIEDEMAK